MKKTLFLIPVGILFLCASASAQKANIDSLTLVAQISLDQLKLGKLQNMVYEKTQNKEGAAVDAQNSANENADAAQKLANDPNNKKLASNANSKAGDAQSDARKSRKQSGRLDDLNKSIMDLKSKIVTEQAKLATYSSTMVAGPLPLPLKQQADTAIHP